MSAAAAAAITSTLLQLVIGSTAVVDYGVRTETGLGDGSAGRGLELTAEPLVGFGYVDRTLRTAARYEPRLLVYDDLTRVAVLHRGALEATWHFEPGWYARGAVMSSRGTADVWSWTAPITQPGGATAPPGTVPAAVQPLPTGTVDYLSDEAELELQMRIAPRLTARSGIAILRQGGADDGSRGVLPLERGGRLWATTEWTAERGRVLAARLDATLMEFSTGSTDGLGQLLASWRERLSAETEVHVGVGPAVTMHDEHGERETHLMGAGEVGARTELLHRTAAVGIRVSIAPFIDPITGSVYERGELGVSTHWSPVRSWSFDAAASGARALSSTQGGEIQGSGEVRAGWAVHRAWELALGVRAYWQSHMPAQWLGYLGVSFRDQARL